MGLEDWTYGTVAKVAALTKRYTNAGDFDVTTTPTEAQVEKFLDRVSAVVNTHLARLGFEVPISESDAEQAFQAVEEQVLYGVTELVSVANSAGRYFTDQALRGRTSPNVVLGKEMKIWCDDMADGLEALGATRTTSGLENIAYRDGDEGGDAVVPLFERKAYGDTRAEWDS